MSSSRLSAVRACRSCPLVTRTTCLYSTSSVPNASTSSAASTNPARLRFAPSPTGFLHLGGLRTALFNHLYARALGGKWILRIEDTDQTRLVPDSVYALQHTLEWAKLDYDEGPSASGSHGPYIQSERLDLYRSYAEKLIADGKAYRDFRPEAVAPADDSARTKQVLFRDNYIPPTESEAKHLISLNRPHVVRLRAPTTALDHEDLVYGSLHFPSDPNLQGTEDPILLKSNGWPTYHLANVVDDHEMGITHVLRGEEWLPSLPKHIWLYRALGLEPPKFAHLPLLVNADGTKLSKRTGDVKVENYRGRGFEPEALVNFLGLMGYNNLAYHQSDAKGKEGGRGKENEAGYDVLTMEEMVRGFDVKHVNRSRATVDLSKLYYLNARHLALKLEDKSPNGGRDELVAKIQPKLVEAFPEVSDRLRSDPGLMENVVLLTKGTSPTLYDVPESAIPLFRRPSFEQSEVIALFAKNSLIHAHFGAAVREAHNLYRQLGESKEKWTREAIHEVISKLPKLLSDAKPPTDEVGGSKVPKSKVKKAAVLAPLRFAISGKERGAPLADLFFFLGKEESLIRLQGAVDAHDAGLLSAKTP